MNGRLFLRPVLWWMPMGARGPGSDPPSVRGRAPRAHGNEASVVIDCMQKTS
jgi:hypothetical protein